ncbi:MAG: hypothetical protein GQ559_05585, partial [Desulfobulbaceae bacterium]|nr:hypothetical protein [Desulfobulbaceae bacterium]
MKHTILVLTCALILHAFSDRASADIPAIWDTGSLTTVTDSSQPAIHEMCLVWQAKGGLAGTISAIDDWEIFAYDLALGTVTQLTDDAVDDILPRTDGTYIVWQKHDTGGENKIFLYQLYGNDPMGGTQISIADNGDHFSPDIADGIVIWSRQQIEQFYSPREILLYNAQTHTGPTVISDPEYSCSAPRIAANLILFEQENPDGTETVSLYDVSEENPVAKPAPENFTWYANPQVDGEQTVLSRYSGSDREIYLHTKTGGYSQITDNALSDTGPAISQNHIAWVADKNIYLTDIATLMHVPATEVASRWPTGFQASWSELCDGVNAYYLDVSTDADFQSFVDGFRALNVGSVTQYIVEGLTPGTTYYYRVYAIVNDSTTAHSLSISVELPLRSLRIHPVPIVFIYKLLL